MQTLKAELLTISDALFDVSTECPRLARVLDRVARTLEWLGGRRYSASERAQWHTA